MCTYGGYVHVSAGVFTNEKHWIPWELEYAWLQANLSPLEEQYALLTEEPSPQPQLLVFYFISKYKG